MFPFGAKKRVRARAAVAAVIVAIARLAQKNKIKKTAVASDRGFDYVVKESLQYLAKSQDAGDRRDRRNISYSLSPFRRYKQAGSG